MIKIDIKRQRRTIRIPSARDFYEFRGWDSLMCDKYL